ncbi:hypothetical protein SESBI_10286 [Sesbania bispinosa]|nr:hypothetical protein SESBI_10286 [Sesbania bispinosa]
MGLEISQLKCCEQTLAVRFLGLCGDWPYFLHTLKTYPDSKKREGKILWEYRKVLERK